MLKKFAPTFFLLSVVTLASAQDYRCGNTNVSITKTGEWESTRYRIIAEVNDRQTELWLNSVDHVVGQCLVDNWERNKIIINAHCGGSGCSEQNYIIIDARTLIVDLVPILKKPNLDEAEQILGISINN